MKIFLVVAALITGLSGLSAQERIPGMALIPGGTFEMGDHHGFVDPKHGGDETPVHKVRLDPFFIGINDVTTKEFCDFLNSALARKQIEMRDGGVYQTGGGELLCETRGMSPFSRIGWDGGGFAVLDRKENHPVVCIRWPGAALYCNWLSERSGRPVCYNPATWDCDFNRSGFRLPTEAEWEFAARGGLQNPYRKFAWGDEADATKANWPEPSPRDSPSNLGSPDAKGQSKNPFRAGPEPWTTPVGFFDGKLHKKADFGWPGAQETYHSGDGVNGFGLYDMAGNVWQFVNDWYERGYYAYSPTDNPPGPDRGSIMPDGKAYRGMRGGNWYNGENGHSRVSNRNPSYFRGPKDPDHPYYHIGFRVALPVAAEKRAAIKPTPVMNQGGRREGGRPPRPAEGPAANPADKSGFVLRSPEVADGGTLPQEFTGDGAAATLPLEWSGVPEGTKSFAVIMHHIPGPGGTPKWYWVLYDIPATVRSLWKNVQGVGTNGNNSINDRIGYAPPHSKGPGPKTYIYTVYALSAPPQLNVPPAQVSRDVLLAAMQDRTLAAAELKVVYSRPDGATAGAPQPAGPENRPQREQKPGSSPGGGRNEGGGRAAMAENKTPVSPNPGQSSLRESPSNFAGSNTTGQTVGLFQNSPKAFDGYTLFAPKHNDVIYLLDNQGRVSHQWKSAYEPGQSVYLKPSGNLLHCCFTKNRGFTSGGEGGRVEEFDWDGKLVWEFDYSSDRYLSHHDIAPLPNGNILMLVVEKKSYDECLAAGFKPEMLRDRQLFPDSVIEVEPTYPKGGRIVWEWKVWDHLIQNSDRAKPGFGDVAAHPELIDVNCNGRPVPAFWNHMNSIAYNPKLDQIALSARGCNEIWLVDHSTSTKEAATHTGGRQGKGGDLIYRWGNPAAYKRGTAADRQLIQQHDAEWVPDGSPGAGHITIFNNGYERGWSSIEEIVPPLDAAGHYAIEPGKAYGPEKPAWHYEAKNRTDFFSSEISGAHRLPNGNTLVCAGVIGNLFEVTPTGETVWQFVNPMVRGGVLAQGEVPGKDVRGHLFNAVFKAHRYASDYPGLRGRDLTPKGVIELPASQKGKTGLDKADASPDERPGGGNRGVGERPPARPGANP